MKNCNNRCEVCKRNMIPKENMDGLIRQNKRLLRENQDLKRAIKNIKQEIEGITFKPYEGRDMLDRQDLIDRIDHILQEYWGIKPKTEDEVKSPYPYWCGEDVRCDEIGENGCPYMIGDECSLTLDK